MHNKKTPFDILCDVLAYLFLISAVIICFIGASACTTPKSIVEHTTVKKDSIVYRTDTLSTSKTVNTFETVYKGIEEAFTIQPDSLGFLPEFKRSFNTGAVQGEIGYNKEQGSYYKIKAKDLKEREHEVKTDTTSKKETKITQNTWIDTVSKTVLVTKKWGRFQWITFIISLFVVLYLIYKAYSYITNPTGLLKIFK